MHRCAEVWLWPEILPVNQPDLLWCGCEFQCEDGPTHCHLKWLQPPVLKILKLSDALFPLAQFHEKWASEKSSKSSFYNSCVGSFCTSLYSRKVLQFSPTAVDQPFNIHIPQTVSFIISIKLWSNKSMCSSDMIFFLPLNAWFDYSCVRLSTWLGWEFVCL